MVVGGEEIFCKKNCSNHHVLFGGLGIEISRRSQNLGSLGQSAGHSVVESCTHGMA